MSTPMIQPTGTALFARMSDLTFSYLFHVPHGVIDMKPHHWPRGTGLAALP
jgi:hypothetical protein